jgi:CRISPR/Cas system CMR-associated protein Cmr1 (group 7 of RAMP superfamily)
VQHQPGHNTDVQDPSESVLIQQSVQLKKAQFSKLQLHHTPMGRAQARLHVKYVAGISNRCMWECSVQAYTHLPCCFHVKWLHTWLRITWADAAAHGGVAAGNALVVLIVKVL